MSAGEEFEMSADEWTPVALPASALPRAPVVRAPMVPAAPPAGYTRAGRPLSAKQMAVRTRWDQAVVCHVQRRDARTTSPKTVAT